MIVPTSNKINLIFTFGSKILAEIQIEMNEYDKRMSSLGGMTSFTFTECYPKIKKQISLMLFEETYWNYLYV